MIDWHSLFAAEDHADCEDRKLTSGNQCFNFYGVCLFGCLLEVTSCLGNLIGIEFILNLNENDYQYKAGVSVGYF